MHKSSVHLAIDQFTDDIFECTNWSILHPFAGLISLPREDTVRYTQRVQILIWPEIDSNSFHISPWKWVDKGRRITCAKRPLAVFTCGFCHQVTEDNSTAMGDNCVDFSYSVSAYASLVSCFFHARLILFTLVLQSLFAKRLQQTIVTFSTLI